MYNMNPIKKMLFFVNLKVSFDILYIDSEYIFILIYLLYI